MKRRTLLLLAVALLSAALLAYETPLGLVAGKRQYGYGPYPENRLDVFVPRFAHAPYPAVLVFHGGGWVTGRPADMERRVCLRYLRRGFVVVNAAYRLGPASPAPAAVDDARAALAWLFRSAPELGVDPARIVVTGESAGGYLALMAASPREGVPPVACVVDFYAPVDLAKLLAGEEARPYAREWLAGADSSAVSALSVLPAVSATFPPTFVVHGTEDREIAPAQSDRLAAALEQAHVPSRILRVPGAGHGGWPAALLDRVYGDVFRFLSERHVCTR